MPSQRHIENTGSTARDWCMLERNILSHVKLCLLLFLLSASVLLRTRLTSPSNDTDNDEDPSTPHSHAASLTLACVLMACSLVALAAGTWEYWSSDRDMRTKRAFMNANKLHPVMLTAVSGIVFAICIVLLADEAIA
ncbi:uncharacterized protein FOMMEDRAFT_87808 [Fomitiporia mediterranea MF3/22]|uniref:uncharacterized protein n=1 Tax=Fomitiporia mediterranea (strain MF3/22) TaxID=694068 RepID=UPI000440888F|nr:uncharacterized protein FOMMEDRAFT_87808 [Fomitiporia mediterranea MF3/22]EJD02069.1 hypothetical protein FOMMEDRAFT_87808 [Fomitiporia mediterranea MF3/22]